MRNPTEPANVGTRSSRALVLAAVILIHMGAIAALVSTIDLRYPAESGIAVEVRFLEIPRRRDKVAGDKNLLRSPGAIRRDVAIDRPFQALVIPPPSESAGAPIDWGSEAERVARDRIARGEPGDRFRSFATHPKGLEIPIGDSNHHVAGETHRYEGGEVITWVSDRCYYTSKGTPDPYTGMQSTQKICKDPPRDTYIFLRPRSPGSASAAPARAADTPSIP